MWRPFLPSSGSPQPARSFNLCTKLLTKANNPDVSSIRVWYGSNSGRCRRQQKLVTPRYLSQPVLQKYIYNRISQPKGWATGALARQCKNVEEMGTAWQGHNQMLSGGVVAKQPTTSHHNLVLPIPNCLSVRIEQQIAETICPGTAPPQPNLVNHRCVLLASQA